jgi:hypothetical protein
MPWMTGLHAIHATRYAGLEMPVVVMTALRDPSIPEQVRALGDRVVLLKSPSVYKSARVRGATVSRWLSPRRVDELERYHAVIHLRTPPLGGYNQDNPLRVESAEEAAAIDARIAAAWSRHPRRFEVPTSIDFFEKVRRAVTIVTAELPDCCHRPTLQSWTDRAARA